MTDNDIVLYTNGLAMIASSRKELQDTLNFFAYII